VQVRFPVLAADLSVLQSALARGPLEVTATGSDGAMGTETGRLSFLDNSVDSLTGTVTGKAVFQNGSGFFWPGQLVFLTVRVGVQNGVLAVPSAAILTGQQGSYVYVVDPQRKTARTQNVTAGRTVGDLSLISAGLAPGMTVVVDGQSRLKPGSKVAIVTGSGDGPGSVAGGGPPGSSSMPQSGAVAAGSTGPGGGGDGGSAGGGSGGAGGGQPGSVTAGVQRTNGAAGQTSPTRTGGGASVANPGAPTTTPTGARSGTGSGSTSPVASPLPAGGRGVGSTAGGARGGAGGTPGGVTAGVGGAGSAAGAGAGGAGTPAGGGRP
jgi:hypothetical protein